MPAVGDQHLNNGGPKITNPFDEEKPRMSEYTAQEIATLQSRLERKLGPEYISSRAGPSGQKVHYLAAEKCIQLANEVFGFNGWSSSIKEVQVDFVDENPHTLKVSLGLSVIVRITLRDGTFHEDMGYGHIENCKGKAAAFEKAKKEGTTDAMKRALRNFGNVLGNCLYDKDYLAKITKIKVAPTKWDVEALHRHSDYTPIKKEAYLAVPDGKQEIKQTSATTLSSEEFISDDFDDFDEADFSVPSDPDSHPDEVVLPAPAPATSHHVNGGPSKQLRPAAPNGQPMPASTRFGNGNNSTGRPGPPHPHALPQTPNNGFQRSTSVGGMQGRLPQGVTALQAPVIQGRILHQPNRPAPLSAPPSPNHPKTSSDEDGDLRQLQPPVGGSVGFFSARAAINSNLEGPEPPQAVKNLPAFDPRAESPSIRRTAGIDHQTSKPLTKNLEHIAVASQVHSPTGVPAHMRPSLMNPSMDNTRRIGAPQSPGSMGMGNRGAYKAPTILKRVNDNSHSNGNDGGTSAGHGQQGMRPPLGDISGQGNLPSADVGGDIKRQRLNGL